MNLCNNLNTSNSIKNNKKNNKINMGYLKLILGPMYAGKSTELIRHIRQYKFLGKSVLCINHKINKRYGSQNIITHDKEEVSDCILLENLSDIKLFGKLYKNSDVIIIEELQFFEDAFINIIEFVEKYNKIVICAGLIGDYKRLNFGEVHKLIPIADNILFLSALCSICKDGTKAPFTKRIVEKKEQNLVGSNESYISVCRKHYLQ
jgi:thymidine kinase